MSKDEPTKEISSAGINGVKKGIMEKKVTTFRSYDPNTQYKPIVRILFRGAKYILQERFFDGQIKNWHCENGVFIKAERFLDYMGNIYLIELL